MFGPDDEDAFNEAKTALMDEFLSWVMDRYDVGNGKMVANADTFLSWRWGYSSGDLTSFDNDDVEEFLLDWVPRKFSAGPEEAPVLCRGVQAMVEFLADTDRLVGGYGRAARVMTHIDGLVDAVAAAMADESKFGMSKTLFSMPLSDDVSLLPT
jgi:hypothetical protein